MLLFLTKPIFLTLMPLNDEPYHKIGIVIIGWKNERDVERFIQKIIPYRQVEWELVVVLNEYSSSHDASSFLHRQHIHYIYNAKNLGYAEANNQGLKYLQATFPDVSYFLLLNTDIDFNPKLITSLLYAAKKYSMDIVGTLLLDTATPDYLRQGGCFYLKSGIPHYLLHKNKALGQPLPPYTEVEYVPGTFCLVRRAVIETIGFLDEKYFIYGEMADFCWRARNKGFLCAVVNDILIEHQHHQRSKERLVLNRYYNLRNRFLFLRKHTSGLKQCYYYAKWILVALKRWTREFVKRDKILYKSTGLALRHGINGQYGKW